MKEVLERLGFTSHEAQIYLCLLTQGRLSAYEVAKKTGLYRQACYDALNRLLERGAVTVLQESRRQIYGAADPDVLLLQLEDERQTLSNALPALRAMRKNESSEVTVEVFRGTQALRLSLMDVVRTLQRCGGENCCTSVDEEFYMRAFPHGSVEYYAREMQRGKLKERVLVRQGAPQVFPTSVTRYASIPEKYFNPHPVQVYGDTVQILLEGKPAHVIIIRNKKIADAFRKQFELMWAVAKPVKKR